MAEERRSRLVLEISPEEGFEAGNVRVFLAQVRAGNRVRVFIEAPRSVPISRVKQPNPVRVEETKNGSAVRWQRP